MNVIEGDCPGYFRALRIEIMEAMSVALTVHPTDGFINRLLQQSTRPAPQPAASKSGNVGGSDQVSISSEARQATSESAPDTRLESKLLQMYNQNGVSSS